MEVKLFGPVHVKEAILLLLLIERVLVWPGQMRPELLAVMAQTKLQFVLAAPGAPGLAWLKVIF